MKKIKGKLLAAAIALIGFSAASAVTGTFAWFTASNIVSVSNMKIQAETEEGIVISNEAQQTWATSAVASHTGDSSHKFIPTSTSNATTWYRNNSTEEDRYGGTGYIGNYLSYTEPESSSTATAANVVVTDGIGVIDTDQNAETTGDSKNIFLVNKFYIRSTSGKLTGKTLYLNNVEITGRAESNADLQDSIRVLVKYDDKTYIYRLAGGAASYNVQNTTATTALEQNSTDGKNKELASDVTIPASNETPLEVKVYAYFEGEDPKCTSKKATEANALGELSVSARFGTKTIA